MTIEEKRILVTGGAGFIGSHVAEFFADKGCEVTVLDNLSRHELLGKTERSEVIHYNWDYLKRRKVRLVKGDVRNADDLGRLCRSADIVVHAAAQTAVTTSVASPDVDFSINVDGTANLLEAIRKLNDNATLVFCSTNKVYGEKVNNIRVLEDERRYRFEEEYSKGIGEDFGVDLCGHTPYGCSKLAGDIYVQDYAQTYGLKTGVFRMSCIYGTRQFGIEDQGWLAWFTIATLTGKPITIYGDGKQVRDVLFISDLVRAYEAFIERSQQLRGEVFNMGGGPSNTLSLLELLSLLKELTGKENRIKYSDWRPADQKVYITDIRKAKERLNWSPSVAPKQGVKLLADWVTANTGIFT
ncbi:MAG: NAD-dependent epimerase/dehydratase family protein [Promethearchaeati archaeon SRVP18_Atabeyarchaeia-1]